jgi:uncharacterized membrane protein
VRKAFLLKLLSDLRASYWFIPGCLVLVAAAGAFSTLALDEFDIVQDALHPLALPRLDAGGMRTILSVIAQSVMGVAGVMFSITMVAVSHASSQFGPRLIGNFMRDRGNQWSLGILIATFVYALIVLRHITGDGLAPNAYPHLTLMISLALALISVCTVIFYVHHVPETINVANISASLGRRLIAAIEATASDAAPREEPDGASTPCPVCLETQGYVLQIDIPLLDRIATAEGTTIRVEVRPGDFVTTYTRVATLDRDATDMAATVRAGFAVGGARIEDQDLTFLVDQQVEMVARALSPGVNDPRLLALADDRDAADRHRRPASSPPGAPCPCRNGPALRRLPRRSCTAAGDAAAERITRITPLADDRTRWADRVDGGLVLGPGDRRRAREIGVKLVHRPGADQDA